MEALTDMQHTINLERLRAQGPQPDERLQPKEPERLVDAAAAPKGPVPDPGIVESLSAAGFGENACKRAAIAVGNSDAEAAMNWLLSHMEDADINNPLPSTDSGAAVPADAESVGMLSAMGFTERQAKAALKSCNGSMERAADWLFTRTDDLEAAVAAVENEASAPVSSTPAAPKVCSGSRPAVLNCSRSLRGSWFASFANWVQ
jgi:ubiquitin carboxyl-terminal hydrolase 5/13